MTKRISLNVFLLLVLSFGSLMIGGLPVQASLSGSMTITPSTDKWTNQDVKLTITGTGWTKIMLPNGTIVSGSSTTYTCSTNGAYSFVGMDAANTVTTVTSYVVSNIDRTGKVGEITPKDSSWKKSNVTVEIKEKK